MIYVIVLSYHAPADLRRCVESVLRTEYPPGRFRLVVVDNEATEETAAALQEYAGRIDILPQRENTGFAEGMNIGIRHALGLSPSSRGGAGGGAAEYVVCLNQDTEVDSAWLKHLVMAMEADPKMGAVQPRIMLGETDGHGSLRMATDNTDGERLSPSSRGGAGGGVESVQLVNSVGNELHVLGFAYAGGHRERWEDVRKRLRGFPYPEVTYCSGACVMLRATALRDVALSEPDNSQLATRNPDDNVSGSRPQRRDSQLFFDSSYFMYHEDVDLGVRLRLRGWTCALAPQAVVTHFYEFSRSMRKLEWMERNRALFLLENFRWPTLLLLAPALLASEIALVVFAVRGGWWPAKRRAWAALLHPANWETYRRARAARQAKRTLPDCIVLRRCTARFANQEMPNAIVDHIINPLVAAWWAVVRRLIMW